MLKKHYSSEKRERRIIPYRYNQGKSKKGHKAQIHWTRNKFHPNWLKYNFISDQIRITKHYLFLYQYWSDFDGDNYTSGKDSLEKELLILLEKQRQLLN